MSVIHGHLRPDQLADAYLSMVETYTDLDPHDNQSDRDQLADEMAKVLETLIFNVGLKEAFDLIQSEMVHENKVFGMFKQLPDDEQKRILGMMETDV